MPLKFLCILLLLPTLLSTPASGAMADSKQAVPPVRIGVTPVILDDHLDFLQNWQHYLEDKLQKPVEFVQRRSYQEVVDLLLAGNIDFAWLCGYPFVQHKQQFRLLAVPLFKHKPLYRSYLIVGKDDTDTRQISDLEGKVFAYSDPNSNSGYLVPQYQLLHQGIDPNHFFRKAFFTWSHRDVIRAVAEGVADAGAVDGYIWETLARTSPELVKGTRVAWKSPRYGFPPVVALRGLPDKYFTQVRDAFIQMRNDRDGQRLLKKLNLDGFSVEDPGLFDSIESNMHFIQDAARLNVTQP